MKASNPAVRCALLGCLKSLEEAAPAAVLYPVLVELRSGQHGECLDAWGTHMVMHVDASHIPAQLVCLGSTYFMQTDSTEAVPVRAESGGNLSSVVLTWSQPLYSTMIQSN